MDEGEFPLHAACEHADLGVVRYLITECRCDVNSRDELERTPLHKACTNSLAIVQYLCEEEDCDPQSAPVVDYFNWSPLHFACQSNKCDIVHYLLWYRNYDVNCRDNFGSTPLHVACKEGHQEMVTWLRSTPGCNVEAQDRAGNTPLHIACHYGHQVDLPNWFLQVPDMQNNAGDTALHVACHSKHT